MNRLHASFPITHCPACGYQLRGLPTYGRCPECGKDYHDRMLWVPGSRAARAASRRVNVLVLILIALIVPCARYLLVVLCVWWLAWRLVMPKHRREGSPPHLFVDDDGFSVTQTPKIENRIHWFEIKRITLAPAFLMQRARANGFRTWRVRFFWRFLAAKLGSTADFHFDATRIGAIRLLILLRRRHADAAMKADEIQSR